MGLIIGGAGYEFAGDYTPKGCYTYSSGTYKGRAYYGTGGTLDQMKTLPGGNKYRPVGYDCNYPGIQTQESIQRLIIIIILLLDCVNNVLIK